MRYQLFFLTAILFPVPAFAHGDIDIVYTLGVQAALVIGFSMYLVLNGTFRQKAVAGGLFYGVLWLSWLFTYNLPYAENKVLVTLINVGAPALVWFLCFMLVMKGWRGHAS